MANERKLTITVAIDDARASVKLRELENVGTRAATGMRGMFGKITPTLGDLRAILGDVVSYGREFIAAAEEQERAEFSLTEALKAHGLATQANIDAAVKYAEATSVQLGIDDEEIKLIQAKIAGLTGLSGDALNQATQATYNLAEMTGRSTDSLALQIAKFVETGAGIRGLNIELDKNASQQERLAALTDKSATGLGILEAKSNTFEGSMNKLTVAWGNLQEAIGAWLTESDAVPVLTDAIIKGLEWLTSAVEGTNQPFNQFVSDVKTIISTVSDAIQWLEDFSGLMRISTGLVTGGMSEVGRWGVGAIGNRYSEDGGNTGTGIELTPPPGFGRGISGVRISNVDEIASAVAGMSGMRLKEAAVG